MSDSYQLHVLYGVGEQGKTYNTAMLSTKVSSSVLDQEDETNSPGLSRVENYAHQNSSYIKTSRE